MRRLYIEIPEPTFREAARRALDERRSTRDQVGYDLERLYTKFGAEQREPDRQPAEDEP
jgi:hypothetical protein